MSDRKLCKRCGAELTEADEEARACTQCGRLLSNLASPPSPSSSFHECLSLVFAQFHSERRMFGNIP